MPAAPPVVVLDDDPTGAQLVDRARVLLAWSPRALREAADAGARTIHLVTNSRALDAGDAYAVTLDAARTARTGLPEASVITRGDSTLRGHLRPEYEALRDGALGGRDRPLLLAMALPSAGRVTRAGVHLLERDGELRPLHDTEFARDPAFGYEDAHLLRWASAASGGLFDAARGREIGIEALRAGGPAVVESTLAAMAGDVPAACVVDAEGVPDLEITAAGLARLRAAGGEAAVRCAPTFAAVLGGNLAAAPAAMPAAGTRGVLVVCGSYVPGTTRQLAALDADRPGALVEADVRALASPRPEPAQRRLARLVRARLREHGVAVLATPRALDQGVQGQAGRERVAHGLAGVLGLLDPPPAVVIAKGGITSAVTLRAGLGAVAADVVGPVAAGVSLWRPVAAGEDPPAYLVVPGNVGDDDLLRRLVASAAPEDDRARALR